MHVFCHYGIPQKIISDNGPEFSAALSKEMGEYMGYRNIYVLPYNPQANGVAEAAVKRLKVLLERHTIRFREWSCERWSTAHTVHAGRSGENRSSP